VILLTGSTGVIGQALLRRMLAAGEDVRCLVRDPRRLGADRVRVQITLGDLGSPVSIRQAVRGVEAVAHLGATIRDQPGGSIEELNGIATVRLLREAERAGVKRFLFFGAMNATPTSRTRFFRTKALAERAVLKAELDSVVVSPSIVYTPGDRWMTLLKRLSLLPWMPVSGTGGSCYQPIWAEDAAACAAALLSRLSDGQVNGRRFELAGPETLTYEEIVKLALTAWDRPRPLVHVPLPVVRRGLRVLEALVGTSSFATWEEAELFEVPMTSERGVADAEALGVDPRPMHEVLGLGNI